MAKESRRAKRMPLSRKAKKNILHASILLAGAIVLTIGTLALTGVLGGRKMSKPLAQVTATPQTVAVADASPAVEPSSSAVASSTASSTASAATQAGAASPEVKPTPSTEENYIAPPKELKPSKPVGDALSLTEALTDDSVPSDAADASSTPEEPTEAIVDDAVAATGTWMQMTIEANRDKIDDGDLDDFYAIIGKLNQSEIYAWANEGFTGEEQKLLVAHMHSRLSDVEYERAKQLFSTYRFILDTM